MKIAILGYGIVGSGINELIHKMNTEKTSDLEVAAILVKDKNDARWQTIRKQVTVTDCFEDIVNDAGIACIVEVMGGMQPAYQYIKSAMKAKKHVVSANKAVIAQHLSEFISLAQSNHVQFLFEASVGGGVPWLKSILDVKRIDSINRIQGILNGTTNYILDQMSRNHLSFAEALRQAQALGYAEADPSADIDGIDVARKLLISAALAWDAQIDMDQILIVGIGNITSEQISYYQSKQYTIKLLAEAIQYPNEHQLQVEPVLVSTNSVIGQIHDNLNWGLITGSSIGELQFIGQGAGKFATANAVIQDILDIKHEIKRPYAKLSKKITASSDYCFEYYIYAEHSSAAARLENYFKAALLEKEEYGSSVFYKTGRIAMRKLRQFQAESALAGQFISAVRIVSPIEEYYVNQKKGMPV